MDGSAYRRLDRVDAVVVDGDALCTGPPVVLEAQGEADGWDDAAVWSAASRLLGTVDGDPDDLAGQRHGCGSASAARESADAPGGELRSLLEGRRRVGDVTVARRARPARRGAAARGHRGRPPAGAVTAHVGHPRDRRRRRRGRRRPTSRSLGHGPAAAGATAAACSWSPPIDGPALLAADVAVAPVRDGRAPAWGADLGHPARLADACRIVDATGVARAVSRRAVRRRSPATCSAGCSPPSAAPGTGSARRRRRASTRRSARWPAAPGRRSAPPAARRPRRRCTRRGTRSTPTTCSRRLADLPDGAGRAAGRSRRRCAGPPTCRSCGGRRGFVRTVAAELSDPLTPVLGTGAAATAMLGESTDAVLVGSVTVGNALLGGVAAAARRDGARVAAAGAGHLRPPRARRRLRGGARSGAPGRATSWSSSPATSSPPTRGCSRPPTSRSTSPT